MGEPAYLIRYGGMGYVGRFRAPAGSAGPLGRGEPVVIQTDRGIELGEILISLDNDDARVQPAEHQQILRAAGPDDLDRWRQAGASRSDRFALCQRVLDDEGWEWDLIDVEPLLEERVTVIQYLGPHHLDLAAIRARFRVTCDLDVVLEPVGDDLEQADHHSGGCGSGGCGSGGCGSGGCGGESGGVSSGCSSCALGALALARQAAGVAVTA